MATFTKFFPFVADVANKVHNLGSDTLKIALFTSATAPTTADGTFDTATTHQLNSSGSTEVANGNGYTAGGTTVAITSSTQTSGTYKLIPTASSITWTATGAVSNIRYIVLYNATAGTSAARPVIGWFDKGSSVTLANTDTFVATLDTTNGLLQLA